MHLTGVLVGFFLQGMESGSRTKISDGNRRGEGWH